MPARSGDFVAVNETHRPAVRQSLRLFWTMSCSAPTLLLLAGERNS
jgi:hypothetical protein